LRRNPDRRYVSSRFDDHTAEHFRSYLKWVGEASDVLRLESAVYYNSFRRSWDKLDGLSGTTRTNIGEALMNPTALQVLKGFGPGNAITRDAFREYELYGWQNQANFRFTTGELAHDLAVGLRLHYDRVAGTNQATRYASNLAGGFGPGVAGPVDYAGTAEVEATAVYLEDAIAIGALTLRPGIRYEYLDVQNRTGAGVHRSSTEDLIMGGMGGNYDIDADNSLFAGIYQGASPANPGGYVTGTDSETSLGYELGYRHQREHLSGELVAFFTDFDDLIAPEVGVGGGGLAPSQNGGSAEVWGLEGLLRYDHGRASNWSLGTPVYASATYTHARFGGFNGRLGNSAGLFAGAVDGAEIPYVPEWKLGLGAGLEGEKWGVYLDMSYVSSTWGTGYNERARLNDNGTVANPTAVDGKIDALLIFDLTAHYQLNDNWKLVGGVHNLFDEQEIVTRAPLGPRANAPRSFFVGCEASF
jgi:Fe(3+) dicitrate transport protein